MIGFHLQGNVDGWPAAVARLPKGAPLKVVDGVQRCAEAKAVNPGVYTVVRHHVGEQNPTGDMRAQAQRFFASFVDDSFRQIARHVDAVQEYNEYFSDSQTDAERARWVSWIQACVDVWRDEYRTQADYAHIDLILAETAVGNNVPLDVARIASKNDFCVIGYHPYVPVRKGVLHPEHWKWYSGRWADMDAVYRYNGCSVRWFFGEFGAVGLTADGWPNSLAPNDGWRHKEVYNGNVPAYLDMMTEWASLLEETPAWQDGRVLGAVLFTSGGGSQWRHFDVRQPEMTMIAEHVATLRANMTTPSPPSPPQPPPPPLDNGLPREQYARVVHVVPQAASFEQYVEVIEQTYEGRQTVGFSYDDAGVGALDKKTAVLWGIAPEQRETYITWYDKWYPGTAVMFREFPQLPGAPPGIAVDVSHYQGDIDWWKMKEAGVTHAYIKASDGIYYADPNVTANVERARAVGIKYGIYHYFRNHRSGTSQAQWFLRNAPAGMMGDLPPALDVEGTGQTAPADAEQIQLWLADVEAATGRIPAIYTGAPYWNTSFKDAQVWAKRHLLWVAHWTQFDAPVIPKDWDTWWLWQYTSKGDGETYGVSSATVDLNRFNALS